MTRRRAPVWWTVPLRSAGPSTWWVAIALVGGAVIGAVLIPVHLWHPWLAAAVAAAIVALMGVLERDALTIRLAVLAYARELAARAPVGFPTDRASAEAWLASPDRAPADPTERAYVLAGVERSAEALELLGSTRPVSALDRARRERLRLALAPAGPIDRTQFDEALAELPAPDRRYQALSLAIQRLDGDLRGGRQWRASFLREVRPLGPFPIGGRERFLLLTQQFAYALVFGVVAVALIVIELIS